MLTKRHLLRYTPTDSANWNVAERLIDITVTMVNPIVNWPTELVTNVNTLLSSITLPGNGFATNPVNGQVLPGTFAWVTPSTNVGSTEGTRAYQMRFTPQNTTNFNTLTQNVNVIVVIPVTHAFTGSAININLTEGSWLFECWGANGAGSFSGRGGYSRGVYRVTAASQQVHLYIGQAGGAGQSPGWNGGGGGGRPGGGGTDIRVGGHNLSNRIIIAGGGGAGQNSMAVGGDGGGLTGDWAWWSPNWTGLRNNFDLNTPSNNPHAITQRLVSGGFVMNFGPKQRPGAPGTQTAGGPGAIGNIGDGIGITPSSIANDGSPGVLGFGGAGGPGNSGAAGSGGGGGYYGGGGGGGCTGCSEVGGGGGGSGFISSSITNGLTVRHGQAGFVTNPDTSGHGFIRITRV